MERGARSERRRRWKSEERGAVEVVTALSGLWCDATAERDPSKPVAPPPPLDPRPTTTTTCTDHVHREPTLTSQPCGTNSRCAPPPLALGRRSALLTTGANRAGARACSRHALARAARRAPGGRAPHVTTTRLRRRETVRATALRHPQPPSGTL